MTEEEAKTKRCCGPAGCGKVGDVVREFGTTVVTVERYCIGSACMAFRQHGWRDKEDGQIKSMAYERADPEYWEPQFHCGLSGKP